MGELWDLHSFQTLTRELSHASCIYGYSTGILWVFYGYSMGIESRLKVMDMMQIWAV
jgi:hypothetical protein